MPTISAGALKRMLNLPANVVIGKPRIERDRGGADVAVVPVRPYARDLNRCAECGGHGRPYDRLPARRWRHLDVGCAKLLLEYAPPRVDCAEHGVTVAMVPWARRKSAYTRDFERQVAWLSVHAPRSAVSALMRIDWKSVGPVCRRVADELRARQGAGLFDRLRSIGVDETSYKRGHKYMTVVVDHDRGRVIWMHQGHGERVFDLFFRELTPEQRASIRVATGDGARWIDECAFRWCPTAERILDGFRIVSWATDALDKVRTAAWREARRKGVAGKGAKDPIKGARWALLKNESDLTAGQKAQLECVANTNETLWEAYKLKERLRMILTNRRRRMPRPCCADGPRTRSSQASRDSSRSARRSPDATSTSSGPSTADYPTPDSRPSTTRSRPPSRSATDTANSTTSSASSCPNAEDSTSNSPDAITSKPDR
ncbi:transposase [Bifidobacterium stellenboschense]|uniref:Transposase n=1 Tax=Bifidobacterium stellenboschense TaxID=762211 RepID=A0A087DN04_9BIFI|nr:transposase [Bifidobacterium stellenboschense]